MRRMTVFMIAIVAALLLAAPAGAGRPGSWANLTGLTGSTQTQVAAVRGADGRLEVAWVREAAAGSGYDLCSRPVSASGGFGGIETILSGWSTLGDPALVLEPGGDLRAFAAGMDVSGAGMTHWGMCTALRSGGVWTLAAGTVDDQSGGDHVRTSRAFAISRPAASPLIGWWSGNILVHAGLDPAQPQYDYQAQFAVNGGYYPSLAVDGLSGTAHLGWLSIAAGHVGFYVQEVGADGSPVGTPQLLPGCAATSEGQPHFIMLPEPAPLTGRPGRAGLVAAYSTGTLNACTVKVWRVGSAPTVIASGNQPKDRVAIAADDAGRVWVVWAAHDTSGGSPVTLYARRSNASVTAWGAPVKVQPPKSGLALYSLLASAQTAQTGRLDLLAHFSKYLDPYGGATWHTQLLPGMTVTADKARLPLGRTVQLRVTVKDAGVPLKGATVRLAGRTARTGSNGVARLTVGAVSRPSTLTAVVALGGYAKATLALKAR